MTDKPSSTAGETILLQRAKWLLENVDVYVSDHRANWGEWSGMRDRWLEQSSSISAPSREESGLPQRVRIEHTTAVNEQDEIDYMKWIDKCNATPAPAETGAEQFAIDICRELYDRFMMGGWEPQDAHAQAAAMFAQATERLHRDHDYWESSANIAELEAKRLREENERLKREREK